MAKRYEFEEGFIRPEDPDACWEWIKAKDKDGYGIFRGRASRYSYEYFVEEIPDDLVIDHTCRNRGCVNPNHLEPVTQQVNTLRGEGPAAINARKTHCVRGHELTLENTYVYNNRGGRRCRLCFQVRFREKYVPSTHEPKPQKTHCIRGHEFTPENTYINKEVRYCKQCSTDAHTARRARLKAEKLQMQLQNT